MSKTNQATPSFAKNIGKIFNLMSDKYNNKTQENELDEKKAYPVEESATDIDAKEEQKRQEEANKKQQEEKEESGLVNDTAKFLIKMLKAIFGMVKRIAGLVGQGINHIFGLSQEE